MILYYFQINLNFYKKSLNNLRNTRVGANDKAGDANNN